MDPVTQGVLGGVAARQFDSFDSVEDRYANNGVGQKISVVLIGALAGMAADLDVLIRSNTDPLLFLEYHRHFTHALVFIPVGALLCALVLSGALKLLRRKKQITFKQMYLWCFAGYATHALLDACTTYGTQLLWPFSDVRVAWNNVSVIDPLFTIPLLVLLVVSVVREAKIWAIASAAYVFFYLGLGVYQQHRALDFVEELISKRGHTPINLGVKPSFANLLAWKSVYEYQDRYYVDAVSIGFGRRIYPGVSVEKLKVSEHFPWLDKQSQQAKDIERFRWFSNDHLALDPADKNRIIDVRYSVIPNQVTGMWGIRLDSSKDNLEHVVWTTDRPKGKEAASRFSELWNMIIGH